MPFLLIIAIVAYLSLIGLAVGALFTRRIGLTSALVAPAAGLGVLLPIVLLFNRADLPIGVCGPPVVAVLAVLAAVCLAVRRPHIPWRDMRVAGPAIAGVLIVTGLPLFLYGFDWLSNSNPDMTLYVASATALLRNGFFHVPPLDRLLAGVDAYRSAWFYQIATPNRYGADVFVATVAATMRTEPLMVYMSCSVAIYATLVAGVAALCRSAKLGPNVTTLAALLVAVASPLTLYSVFQQLLPQVCGLAAMVALAALMQVDDAAEGESWLARGAIIGCCICTLVLCYPEIAPILVFGALIAAGFLAFRERARRDAYAYYGRIAAAAAGAVVVLLNVQLPTIFATYQTLAHIGAALGTIGVINYYLLPAGFAYAWGLMPMGIYWEPGLSIGIAAGVIACLVTAVASVRNLPGGRLSATMLVAIEILCVVLFMRRSSYALFKMVFLMQPFLAPLVASGIFVAAAWLSRKTRLNTQMALAIAAGLPVAATLFSTSMYLGAASDMFVHKFSFNNELPGISNRHILRQLGDIARALPGDVAFRSDAPVLQVSIYEGLLLHGHPIADETQDTYGNLFSNPTSNDLPIWPHGVRARAHDIALQRARIFSEHQFQIADRPQLTFEHPVIPAVDSRFTASHAGAPDEGVLLESGPHFTVFNHSLSSSAGNDFDVRAVRWHEVKNWLSLVDSSLGHIANAPATDGTTAIGPMEPDGFDKSRAYTTLGRGMLLEVVNPSPAVSLRFDVTGSYNDPGDDVLPGITVIGSSIVQVPLDRSHGAARIVTPPVRPAEYHGRRYLAVLIDHPLVSYPERRSFLLGLFGNDIRLDPRTFTLIVRDISVADRPLQSPSRFEGSISELENPALVYRGIFEDGWMSPYFSMNLRAPQAGQVLHFHFNVPPGRPERTIDARVDGRLVRRFVATPSRYFDVRVAGLGAGEHHIELIPPDVTTISKADGRLSWGRLLSAAFEPAAGAGEELEGNGVTLKDEAGWYPHETFAGRGFRWMHSRASLAIAPASRARVLHLRVAPDASAGGPAHLRLSFGSASQDVVVSAERELTMPIPPANAERDLVLSVPRGKTQAPGDPRDLSLRVFSASVSDR